MCFNTKIHNILLKPFSKGMVFFIFTKTILMKIIIINGPNLNLLGKREPEIYGNATFESYFEKLQLQFPGIALEYFQSNIEGEIISKIQEVGFTYDGIVLNAGAYTHTSIGIGDAVAIDSSVYLLAVQISSKKSKANSHSEGNLGSSQNQNPILYRFLKYSIPKLLKTFFTKKYGRDFSDLTVVLDEYEEDADDTDDDGNWVSAESYYFTVYSDNFDGSQPLIELYQLSRELFGNIIGSKNWIDIEFKNYPL
jgi:3-dehydroquinate dehydratase-2